MPSVLEPIFLRVVRRLVAAKRDRFFKRFTPLMDRPSQTQERVLLDKVRRNADSDLGRRFGFGTVRSVADFQGRFPVSDYDVFEPYIERLRQGDLRAVFGPKERLHMFAMTSGTTGRAKYIPVTTSFLEEYREGSAFWASCLAVEFGRFVMGRVLPIFSPIEEERAPSGLPCGAISGLIAKTQGPLVSAAYGAPFEVSLFKDPKERQYAFLRAALEHTITLMITANPSTLVSMAKTLSSEAPRLIQDLARGTLFGKKAPFRLAAKPGRARELELILERQGTLRPRDVWPLQAIACWTGGTLFHYLKLLPDYYGSTMVRDLGLLASEGRFSLPIFPDTQAGLLNIFHHFLEFIPEDEEDWNDPKTLLAHELEVGKRYFLVVTTSSGLYRYKLHDLIEVTAFHRSVPLVVFLNKGKHIASMTGEKLTEHQASVAVHATAEEAGVGLKAFRLAPVWPEGASPFYALLFEAGDIPTPRLEAFARALDERLLRLNLEYAAKRSSLRLGPAQVLAVSPGTFSELQKKSHRPEQFKPVYLETDPSVFETYWRGRVVSK